MKNCQPASRTCIKAYRIGKRVLIVAEGSLPTPGYTVNVEQSPIRIFPPHFALMRCALPGVWPEVLTPYRHPQAVEYPPDQPEIHIVHATGADDVRIKDLVAPPADGGEQPVAVEGPNTEAVGFSDRFSFDEAFQNALAAFDDVPAEHPDQLVTVKVEEIGALFGGVAGFNDLFVRLSRSWD